MAEKYIHRYPPCPAYETRRFERWLEDMAKDGWFLAHFALSRFGSIQFTKSEPNSVRFRLQPAPRKAGKFSRRDQQQEAVDLAADFGWVLQDLYEGYFIYYTINPDVPELDTDPHVQALALQEHRKRKRNRLFKELLIIFLFLAIVCLAGPISVLLSRPVWFFPLLLLILFLVFLLRLKELTHLKRLQQQLEMKETPGSDTEKAADTMAYRAVVLAPRMLSILVILAVILAPLVHLRSQPVAEHMELPFATIEDVTGGVLFPEDQRDSNIIAIRSTVLADVHIRLKQYGDILRDGTVAACVIMDLDYYEMRSPWLAEQLYREILPPLHTYQEYAWAELPALPVDQAAAYSDVYPTLLLQEDTKVLRVRIFWVDEHHGVIHPAEWAPVYAASLLD